MPLWSGQWALRKSPCLKNLHTFWSVTVMDYGVYLLTWSCLHPPILYLSAILLLGVCCVLDPALTKMEQWIRKESFPSGSSYLQCFQDSSMLQHVSELHSFLWLNNISLYVYSTLKIYFKKFIHLLILRLFPCFGCCEHPHVSVWVTVFSYLDIYLG